MAELQDAIKKSGLLKQGGLYQTSGEELSNLSAATGRAAAPISPLGAKLLGANPHQVKMAGSSANKDAALEASVSGDLSLRDTIRRGQASTQTTGSEQEKKKKEEVLGGFQGGLDTRVQQLALKKLDTGVTSAKPQVSLEKVASVFPGLNPVDQPKVAASINKVMQNPSDLEATKEVAAALGMNVSSLSADQLIAKVNQTIESKKDTLISAGKAIEDSIRMSDVFGSPEAIQALGDPASIAAALGVSEDDFQNMDVPALQKKMEEMGLKSFNDVAELQRRAADPYTLASERAALNKELQRLGASGVRGTEQDYQKIQDEVNSANQVEVGGKSYTTEELLSDENISVMIADYLTDPEAKEALAGTPLADFIERNKAVLTQASNNLSSNAKGLVAVTQANRDLAKTRAGSIVPDNVMSVLFPTWDSLSANKIDPTSSPLYQKFSALPESTQNSLIKTLGEVKDPELIKSILAIGPETLQNLSSNGGLTSWIGFRKSYDDAINMSPELAVNTLLGTDPATFSDALLEYRNAQKMGFTTGNFQIPLANLLDSNHDGVLDNPKTLKAALLQYYQDAAHTVPRDVSKIPNPAEELSKLNNLAQSVTGNYGILRDYIKKDGYFDTADVKEYLKGPTNDADLLAVFNTGGESVTAPAKTAISNELNKRADSRFADGVLVNLQEPIKALKNKQGNGKILRDTLAVMLPSTKAGSVFDKAAASRAVTTLVNSLPIGQIFYTDEFDKSKFISEILKLDTLNTTTFGAAIDAAKASYKSRTAAKPPVASTNSAAFVKSLEGEAGNKLAKAVSGGTFTPAGLNWVDLSKPR